MVGDDSLRPKKGRECMEDEIGVQRLSMGRGIES